MKDKKKVSLSQQRLPIGQSTGDLFLVYQITSMCHCARMFCALSVYENPQKWTSHDKLNFMQGGKKQAHTSWQPNSSTTTVPTLGVRQHLYSNKRSDVTLHLLNSPDVYLPGRQGIADVCKVSDAGWSSLMLLGTTWWWVCKDNLPQSPLNHKVRKRDSLQLLSTVWPVCLH